MKNDLDTLPLNARRKDSVKGYLFIDPSLWKLSLVF